MELANFIRYHKEEITNEWIKYARENIKPTFEMQVEEVTDHIKDMLERIAEDMDTSQTNAEQEKKSKGNKALKSRETKAASEHGAQRVELGFDIMQLSSEFRALRASILRLWAEKIRAENWETDFHDMIRFNEAIDEAWMISLDHFQQKLDQSKNWFLGVLGHDLRNPISAVYGAQAILKLSQNLSEKEKGILQRSDFSLKRMTELINNLLEFTELNLGRGVVINRSLIDLSEHSEKIVQEIQLAYPKIDITIDTTDNIKGKWDASRLEQMMTNLITNAIHHGEPGSPVKVNLNSKEGQALFSVHNQGTPIPEGIKDKIFTDRFTNNNEDTTKEKNYGLGLYIVKEIVEGHEGKIELTSTQEEGTIFTVALPIH